MATFQSIKELTRGLQQGAKLLGDMFMKRKTVAIRYDDAVDALDGDENRLRYLINFGVVVRNGDFLELDDVYQQFFEEVLSVNEEINIAAVQTYISKLKLGIESYLAAENSLRKAQFLREIRHTFLSIDKATIRNVVDLKRNVDDTYKQEPNFKIKKLRLNDFDEKRKQIVELIRQTEKVMDEQTIFFASAMDVGLKQTVSEVRIGLHESAHGLIDIAEQIIDYLNRIEYQSRLVRKIRQLKYLKDQFMIQDSTDINEQLALQNPVWMEKLPKYSTKVSLDFLRNDDAALDILNDVRRRLSKKTLIKSRLAGKIDERYLEESQEISRAFNHREIINGFLAQGTDLFNYVWNYRFQTETDREQRLVLFLQLASQYNDEIRYTFETRILDNIEYPIIYPK